MTDHDAGTSAARQGATPARRGRVVISSVTGEPIPWDDKAPAEGASGAQERRPVLPRRVAEDAPDPGADESNDARIAGDVPPHWGRGR